MRCCNIDWLECYCIEDSIEYPHNADYFRRKGWEVREREYGTPMYSEMFTLFDNFGEPFIEIRRNPKSSQRAAGIFDANSCHVRLSNRTCYANNAAILMQNFLEENRLAFQRISRIDICLDFERFDYGDEPQKFLQRFMAGRYSKINQANISAHGLDQWDGRMWNSISWGSKTSMVGTKFYNKTKELREVKDKPYIRQAWQQSGLVDDMTTLEKVRRDGTRYKPDIWRVEFSIKSSTRKWFVVEDYQGDRKRIKSMRNTLDVYSDRKNIFQVFLSLSEHYFHFKIVEYKATRESAAQQALETVIIDPLSPFADSSATRELQRKDRCKDKLLFKKSDIESFYQIEKLCTNEKRNERVNRLLMLLYEYREKHGFIESVRNACNVLIEKVEHEQSIMDLSRPFDENEMEILRRIISIRLKSHNVPVNTTRKEVEAMLKIEREIWTNPF